MSDPTPILRIRRLIARGDLGLAGAACRDLATGADFHDAHTLTAIANVCGVKDAADIALAILDGHSERVGWVLEGQGSPENAPHAASSEPTYRVIPAESRQARAISSVGSLC